MKRRSRLIGQFLQDTQHNQESLEEVRNNEAAQEGRCPEPLQISSTRATSSNSDIHLIHKRLPKVVVNIQGRSTSLQTPSPIPKNPLRSQQLQEILEPLHLSLLREESGPDSKKFPVPAADSETHLRILQSLIHQTPKVLSLPNLHLKVQELKRGQTESPFPSACRVLQNAQRNFVKTQTLEQDSETWKPHRTLRLSKILESVTRLDASVKLKRRAWMFKPRDGGSAKDKLQAELKFRNALRNQYPPPAESKTLPTDVEEFESNFNQSIHTLLLLIFLTLLNRAGGWRSWVEFYILGTGFRWGEKWRCCFNWKYKYKYHQY